MELNRSVSLRRIAEHSPRRMWLWHFWFARPRRRRQHCHAYGVSSNLGRLPFRRASASATVLWKLLFFPARYGLRLLRFDHPLGLGGPGDDVVWGSLIPLNGVLWAGLRYFFLRRARVDIP